MSEAIKYYSFEVSLILKNKNKKNMNFVFRFCSHLKFILCTVEQTEKIIPYSLPRNGKDVGSVITPVPQPGNSLDHAGPFIHPFNKGGKNEVKELNCMLRFSLQEVVLPEITALLA